MTILEPDTCREVALGDLSAEIVVCKCGCPLLRGSFIEGSICIKHVGCLFCSSK